MSMPDFMVKNDAFVVLDNALRAAGFDSFAVGGCVRDGLLGLEPNDVDVATNARPHDLPKLLGMSGMYDGDDKVFRNGEVALYPTGVSHGTWTVRVGDNEVEVTTFRQDVSTDGRRATVRFADTMEEDAQRRDFTMNALYMSSDGQVYDPTRKGRDDLREGVVRFVGDADERCKEDYLRVMRLFRFQARYGKPGEAMDFDAFMAAQRHAPQVKAHVSGERVWDEFKKLMAAPRLEPVLGYMWRAGLFNVFFEDYHFDRMYGLMDAETMLGTRASWVARYWALVGPNVPFPHARDEMRALEAMEAAYYSTYPPAGVAYLYGEAACRDLYVMRGEWSPRVELEMRRGAGASLPLTGADLMEYGFPKGPGMGKALGEAKDMWLKSDLTLTKDELRAAVV